MQNLHHDTTESPGKQLAHGPRLRLACCPQDCNEVPMRMLHLHPRPTLCPMHCTAPLHWQACYMLDAMQSGESTTAYTPPQSLTSHQGPHHHLQNVNKHSSTHLTAAAAETAKR